MEFLNGPHTPISPYSLDNYTGLRLNEPKSHPRHVTWPKIEFLVLFNRSSLFVLSTVVCTGEYKGSDAPTFK